MPRIGPRIRVSLLIAAVMLCGCSPMQLHVELSTPVRTTPTETPTSAPAEQTSVSQLLSESPAVAPKAEPTPGQAAKPVELASEIPSAPTTVKQEATSDVTKIDVRLRGRINVDADFVGQSARNQMINGTINDATGFRRARLGAEGEIGDQVNWVAEFDFAGAQISFKDVYGEVSELPIVRRIRVGHMLEPFSLEGQTSSNYFTFAERSSIAALDPARSWGVEIRSYTENERATLQLGAFRTGSNNNSGDDLSGQYDLAFDLRATCLPWYDDEGRRLWHIGGAFSQRAPFNDVVIINQKPQNSLLSQTDDPGSPFLPQITIPASQQQLFNLQTAAVFGSLSFQAEWNGTTIQQIGGGPVFLHGVYGFASWFLTGENRNYVKKDGDFGITKVRAPFVCMSHNKLKSAGPGAWELAVRFAYADFANSNIPPSNGLKVGDKESTLTVGVNWYLNDYVRLLVNYVHAIPVDPNFGPSYADAVFLRTIIFW